MIDLDAQLLDDLSKSLTPDQLNRLKDRLALSPRLPAPEFPVEPGKVNPDQLPELYPKLYHLYFMRGVGYCEEARRHAACAQELKELKSREYHVGDIVKTDPKLMLDKREFADAVVVSVRPLVLVSRTADMIWKKFSGKLTVSDQANTEMLCRCLIRYLQFPDQLFRD
jgi:hypothetical protein